MGDREAPELRRLGVVYTLQGPVSPFVTGARHAAVHRAADAENLPRWWRPLRAINRQPAGDADITAA